ncbi:MAG TPA: hypothetical protein VMN58_03720 [Acidimicrobiales bacterium]|nr:hypothetical protein [Acidimicrobiales bacterium]
MDTLLPIVIGVIVVLAILALVLVVVQRKRRSGSVLASLAREASTPREASASQEEDR